MGQEIWRKYRRYEQTAGPSTASLAMGLRETPLRMTISISINHLSSNYISIQLNQLRPIGSIAGLLFFPWAPANGSWRPEESRSILARSGRSGFCNRVWVRGRPDSLRGRAELSRLRGPARSA